MPYRLTTEAEYQALLAKQRGEAAPVAKKPVPRLIPSEDDEQMALCAWARLHEHTHPELAWLFHVANGGSRHPLEAKKLKFLGVRPGVFDLLLLCPRGPYMGLAIEMKSRTGKPTKEQLRFYVEVRKQGYHAVIAYGFEQARAALLAYLALPGVDRVTHQRL